MGGQRFPRVLFISGREAGYIRNRVLLQALRANFQVTVLTPEGRSGIMRRSGKGLVRLITQRPTYDVCFVGFYGQPLAIVLSVLQRKAIVFDAYISTYETLCEDRKTIRPRSPAGYLAYWLDSLSYRFSTQIVTDTRENARYLKERFGVPGRKITPIYVGCDESLFYPHENLSTGSEGFEIFYYGAFLPLHGTEVIIRAAALLRHRPEIHFTIGGSGPEFPAVRRLAMELSLTNVDFVGWVPLTRLPDYIARATLCLGGHFSTIPKARRVISTKTFQFLAMRKPTIVADNAAVREVLTPGEHVYAVPMGDAKALAEAIQVLVDNRELRDSIARGGYQAFQKHFATRTVAGQLVEVINKALCVSVS